MLREELSDLGLDRKYLPFALVSELAGLFLRFGVSTRSNGLAGRSPIFLALVKTIFRNTWMCETVLACRPFSSSEPSQSWTRRGVTSHMGVPPSSVPSRCFW